MKIIFSRKGFDSSSGGCPSPILPDGRMFSLPIPCEYSKTLYDDIRWDEYNIGEIVCNLTNKKISSSHRAHLDPDIRYDSYPRNPNWKPIFGQIGNAQGHLRNQKIAPGDIFLFFGLFQDAIFSHSKLLFDTPLSRKHVIWGWLQIEDICKVDECSTLNFQWASYHPHFNRPKDENNTISSK